MGGDEGGGALEMQIEETLQKPQSEIEDRRGSLLDKAWPWINTLYFGLPNRMRERMQQEAHERWLGRALVGGPYSQLQQDAGMEDIGKLGQYLRTMPRIPEGQ